MITGRWTIKELNEMDDITFAMCILSERREKLNQEAPLAKKLKKAYNTLNDVRGGAPMNPISHSGWGSIRQRIFKEVEDGFWREDLEIHLEHEKNDLKGFTADEIMADEEIIEQIRRRYDKCETDHWSNMEYAIETGIEEVLERRRSKGYNKYGEEVQ